MTHTRPDWEALAQELGVDVSPKLPSANTDQMAQKGLRPTNGPHEQWVADQLARAERGFDAAIHDAPERPDIPGYERSLFIWGIVFLIALATLGFLLVAFAVWGV